MRRSKGLPRKRKHPVRKRPQHKPTASRPRLAPRLKGIFEGIGVPRRTPFRPDPFQAAALDGIQSGDVLVIAPTGSGKTWVAQEAIRTYLAQNKRSWYASPLKALSNAKFAEFSKAFGSENVGILTGDRKERPDAPVIVGTTEILRNQLYDAMTAGQDMAVDLAILDEAHYLSDPDRGVVWEEVLIYLPGRVRLLLLSATVGNGEEIRQWLEETRGIPCHVVASENRPVPLHVLFLFPDGEITPLATHRGILPKIQKFLTTQRPPRGNDSIRFGWVIEQLRRWDLLPAIFFLKSRADCDQAVRVERARSIVSRLDDSAFKRDLHEFLDRYPFLKNHGQLPCLQRFRLGSHHGGQLPQWKLLIEEMMSRGYLDAIYSTSTVAAGVNFPARTVVLVQSDRFDGRRFSDLTATELHQMTGRAGRRGKDRIGFALVLPGLYQDPLLIHQLIDSPPEPINSQIQISFSMVLNLLLSHRPSEIRQLLDQSLAAFQERRSQPDLKRQWKRLVNKLRKVLPEDAIPQSTPVGILETIRAETALRERIETLRGRILQEERELLFARYLKRGTLFVHKSGRTYVAFDTFHHRKKAYCSAHRLAGSIKGRRRQIRLKRVPLQTIDYLFDYRVDIPEDASAESLSSLFGSIPMDELRPIRMTPEVISVQREELRRVESELAALPDLYPLRTRARYDKNTRTLLKGLERLALSVDQHRHQLWNEFNRHVEFLKETGFVDEDSRLTPDGRWASCLRLDHPLLIAEAIRKGIFDGADPPTLAALIAPFVVDKTREVEVHSTARKELEDLKVRLARMVRGLHALQDLKQMWGFETLQMQFWPAASLLLWARGVAWEELIGLVPVEEGDMAILVMRTADHLRQLFDLEKTHPPLVRTAREVLPMILREPVYTL